MRKAREDDRLKAANISFATPVVLTVIDKSENGFVVDWVAGETSFEGSPQSPSPADIASANALREIHLEIELNSLGQLRSLRNHLDVLARVTRRREEFSQPEAAPAAGGKRKAPAVQAAKMLAPETLIVNHMNAAGLFFVLSGLSLDSEKPIQGKMVTGHPINVGRISSDTNLAIQKIDSEKKEALIHLRQEFDPNGFAGLTRQILAQSGVAVTAGQSMPDVNLTDVADYALDLAHGWVRRLKHERTIAVGTVLRRLDRIEIEVKNFKAGPQPAP
ncbi:MAG TPA: hypothetical protein VM120_12605 [Bryobacteraceae bacterium]|nr:hypothetical protein [Bryobacteraceae bacterium]